MIGMDFGTTNTGAAVFDGDSIRLLPLDPASSTPTVCRTSIYITRSRDYYLGSTALNLYFNQNVGRPTRYRKVKVGEIMQVFAELPTFYRDVFVYEDEFSPGRLFVSIKTALRNPNYFGTVFLNSWYSASDLAATFLLGMKLRIDKTQPSPVKDVVLGRPVHFSDKPDEDKIAQSRLLQAAFKAGFEQVYLEYEPVAAALSYERTIKDKEIVLVFDFGGGTLDFTIMEIGIPGKRHILATGGIPIAGDVFDQRLFRATIPRHLGENDYFLSGGVRYPIPAHIFDLLSTPHEILSLNTPQNLEMLRSIHNGAIEKDKTHALLRIVSSNYALLMFDLIEKTKRQLSKEYYTRFSFNAEDFSIQELILRSRFEQAIQREYEIIRSGLQEVIAQSGLTTRDIDRVIRTGGSSQIPLFVELLNDMFGFEKVRQIDVFSSVTSGLAIRAHEIASGREELAVYTPDSARRSEEIASPTVEQEVLQIDLDTVKRRLEVAQDFTPGQAKPSGRNLLVLEKTGLRGISVEEPAASQDVPLSQGVALCTLDEPIGEAARGAIVRPGEHVLLATNQFKLISVSMDAVLMAQEVGDEGLRDLLRLEPDEMVTAFLPWQPENIHFRFLCLLTNHGQARSFEARLLAEHITKMPFFQLERRYVGIPTSLVPAGDSHMLLTGTSSGRAAWVPARDILVVVYDMLKTRRGEAVTASAAFEPDETLLAMNERGDLLRVPPLPASTGLPPASRGHALRKNFNITAFLSLEYALQQPVYALSSYARLYRLALPSPSKLTLSDGSIRTIRLNPGEKIIGLNCGS